MEERGGLAERSWEHKFVSENFDFGVGQPRGEVKCKGPGAADEAQGRVWYMICEGIYHFIIKTIGNKNPIIIC
jgi:hypothetical protein